MISNFHVAHLTANGAMGNANGEKNRLTQRTQRVTEVLGRDFSVFLCVLCG